MGTYVGSDKQNYNVDLLEYTYTISDFGSGYTLKPQNKKIIDIIKHDIDVQDALNPPDKFYLYCSSSEQNELQIDYCCYRKKYRDLQEKRIALTKKEQKFFLNKISEQNAAIEKATHDYFETQIPIKEIIKKHNLNISTSQLYKMFPPVEREESCKYCNKPLFQYRPSRTASSCQLHKFCKNCGHKEISFCTCVNCKNERLLKREREKAEQKKLWQEKINCYDIKNFTPVAFENISFKEKVSLGALLLASKGDSLKKINPPMFAQIAGSLPIIPTQEIARNTLTRLTRSDIIIPDPYLSEEDAIEKQGSDFVLYLFRCYYNVNVSYEDCMRIYNGDIGKFSLEEFFELWQDIAYAEAIDILNHLARKENWTLNVENEYRLTNIVKQLITQYSVAQINYILYRCVKNTKEYILTNQLPQTYAMEILSSECELFPAKYHRYNQEMKRFDSRTHNCPRSALSIFLFDRVLKIGDSAYYKVANMQTVKEILHYNIPYQDMNDIQKARLKGKAEVYQQEFNYTLGEIAEKLNLSMREVMELMS